MWFSNFHWGINWLNLPGCARFVLTSYIGCCYNVTSNFSIWFVFLVSVGFRGDIYLPWSVNCSCRAFELFILDTAPAYLIGLSRPNVLTYLFVFFLQKYKVSGFIIVCVFFSFFVTTFLSPASSDSTLVAIGYLCFDHQGEQRTNPWSPVVPSVSCCHLGVSIWIFCQDVSQRCYGTMMS